MANFPQSLEPVNSDSILEQFLQLKGNVNRVNTGMVNVEQTADSAFEKSSNNEYSIQVLENNVQTLSTGLETAEQNLSKCVRFDVQSLTDAQKAQARSNIGAGSAMATTVLVNGVAQTQIQFDSDPQTQIDLTKNEISALDEKALKTPMTAPAENEIPTINTANAQVNVTVGDGLKIESNELKVDKSVIYPVGSIYMSTENTSPASMFGGTWEQILGKFLLSSDDFLTNGIITTVGSYHVNDSGGEATHTLTVDEMPSHTHTNNYNNQNAFIIDEGRKVNEFGIHFSQEDAYIAKEHAMNATGGSQAHNNMPPYLVVYCWKRIS